MSDLIHFILHIDDYLREMIKDYGVWIYAILFLIIFVETGLVIMPFLPGDSLLFAAGMLSVDKGGIDIIPLIIILIVAAILGDSVNYFLGNKFSPFLLKLKFRGKALIKQEYIDKTHAFFEKHGTKTIIIARFVPIVRTIAPFVAGIGSMNFKTFFSFNVIGGLLWVIGLSLAGYFLGSIPWIKDNFEKVIFGIIFISILPIIFEFLKAKFSKGKS
jgi:membrane-associated protein